MPAPHDDPAAALCRLPFFASASAEDMARFLGQARWIGFGPDEVVTDFDDQTTDVYVVLQGSFRILVRTADGEHTRILGDFFAGNLVGELSAVDVAAETVRIEALVRARLCVVPASAFLRLALGVPEIGLRVMRLLTGRVRAQNRRVLEHVAFPTRLWVVAELLRLSRPRSDGTFIISPPPLQEDLAKRVGARRETVARELGAITRAGLLQRNKAGFVSRDPAALHRLVHDNLHRSYSPDRKCGRPCRP